MALDPELIRHKEWLGFLQPVGLVVSPPALMAAQAVVNRNVVSLQQRLLDVISSEVGIRILSARSPRTIYAQVQLQG